MSARVCGCCQGSRAFSRWQTSLYSIAFPLRHYLFDVVAVCAGAFDAVAGPRYGRSSTGVERWLAWGADDGVHFAAHTHLGSLF